MSKEIKSLAFYSRLDQRVVPHGKALFALIRDVAASLPGKPTSRLELEEHVLAVLGVWKPSDQPRMQPQNVLAMEYFTLLDEIATESGVDVAAGQARQFLDTVLKVVSKYKDLGLIVWRGELTPAAQITPINAYSVLNQRALQFGFQLHDDLHNWVLSKTSTLAKKPIGELALATLAKEYMTTSPRFSKVYAQFLAELATNDSSSQIVVVQTAVSGSFARSIRRYIKDIQAEAIMSEKTT
jgi:hypothetical protein